MQDERSAKQCIAFRQRVAQFADRADGLVPVTGGQDCASFFNQIGSMPQSRPEGVQVHCDGHRSGFRWQCCHSPFLLMSRPSFSLCVSTAPARRRANEHGDQSTSLYDHRPTQTYADSQGTCPSLLWSPTRPAQQCRLRNDSAVPRGAGDLRGLTRLKFRPTSRAEPSLPRKLSLRYSSAPMSFLPRCLIGDWKRFLPSPTSFQNPPFRVTV